MAAKKKATDALATKEATKTSTKTSADLIVTVAAEVENMTDTQLFAAVPELIGASGDNEFKLGGVLAVIKSKGLFGDFESFDELCVKQFGLKPRVVSYFIKIYDNLVQKQIPYASVKHLGWTKLRELVEILTAKNVESWVKRAEKYNVVELVEAVKKAKAKAASGTTGEDANESDQPAVKVFTFKLHDDQIKPVREALEKMKGEANTAHDTVALSNICLGYIGGTIQAGIAPAKLPKTKKAQIEMLVPILKKFGMEVMLKAAFDKGGAFPDVTIDIDDSNLPKGYGAPEVEDVETAEA